MARLSVVFTGAAVRWVGYRDNYSGIANVYIDGTLKGQVDAYSTRDEAQVALYSTFGLSSGTHTLTVEGSSKVQVADILVGVIQEAGVALHERLKDLRAFVGDRAADRGRKHVGQRAGRRFPRTAQPAPESHLKLDPTSMNGLLIPGPAQPARSEFPAPVHKPVRPAGPLQPFAWARFRGDFAQVGRCDLCKPALGYSVRRVEGPAAGTSPPPDPRTPRPRHPTRTAHPKKERNDVHQATHPGGPRAGLSAPVRRVRVPPALLPDLPELRPAARPVLRQGPPPAGLPAAAGPPVRAA